MMFCSKCGYEAVEKTEVCGNCGAKLQVNVIIDDTTTAENIQQNNATSKTRELDNLNLKINLLRLIAIILSVVLISCFFGVFIEYDEAIEHYDTTTFCDFLYDYDYDDEQEVSLRELIRLNEIWAEEHNTTSGESYGRKYKEELQHVSIVAKIILLLSVIQILFAIIKQPVAICISAISVIMLSNYISDYCLYTRNLYFEAYLPGPAQQKLFWIAVIQICICALFAKMNNKEKEIKHSYKIKGILQYEANDYAVCPSCRKSMFVKMENRCHECDFRYNFKAVNMMKSQLAIYGILGVVMAIFSSDSTWISALKLGKQIQQSFSIDGNMCVIYWILSVSAIAIALGIYNRWKIIKYVHPIWLVAINAAPIIHMFILSDELPSMYSQGCKACAWIVLVGSFFEILHFCKEYYEVSPYFE